MGKAQGLETAILEIPPELLLRLRGGKTKGGARTGGTQRGSSPSDLAHSLISSLILTWAPWVGDKHVVGGLQGEMLD